MSIAVEVRPDNVVEVLVGGGEQGPPGAAGTFATLGLSDVRDAAPAPAAVGDGSTSDTAAYNAKLAAMPAESGISVYYAGISAGVVRGGTLYLRPGHYVIDAEVQLDRYENIIGAGKDRTVLLLTAAAATIRIGRHLGNTAVANDYAGNRRSRIEGFTIDGGGVATHGLQVGRGAEFRLTDINVVNCLTAGITFEETQNVTCTDVNAQRNGTNLVLDRGAAGLEFLNCEYNEPRTGYNLHIKGTSGYDGGTTPCQQIKFDTCRFERQYGVGVGTLGMVLIDAARHLKFDSCAFSVTADHTMNLVTVAKNTSMVTSHVRFSDCFWQGVVGGGSFTTTGLLTIGAVSVLLIGKNTVNSCDVGINRGASGTFSVQGQIETSDVTTFFAGTGNESQVLFARFSHGIAPNNTGAVLYTGSGSPAAVLAASPGSLYLNTAGGAGATLWIKESGSGTSGWVAYTA